MDNGRFLGEFGLILLAIVLLIILVPVLIGYGFAILIGAKGLEFYGAVVTVAGLIWLGLCCLWWLN